ncbi:CLUMA_CG013965, isoform A [Clunio marinus]|uniref:CLUMA_CG013965, isoform A n=1 Tax=Clunio marinus TaxID=568069 RepID=A0A1J1IMB7_9DIPT|nr:CLUMA_CG013965, isoform A [Clunio marinus]
MLDEDKQNFLKKTNFYTFIAVNPHKFMKTNERNARDSQTAARSKIIGELVALAFNMKTTLDGDEIKKRFILNKICIFRFNKNKMQLGIIKQNETETASYKRL